MFHFQMHGNVYPNTPAKLKGYQDLMIRNFHFVNADAKQMQNMIKTVLKTKDLFLDEKTNSLAMRDTPGAVRLAEKLVAGQDITEPEVVLEVEVLEVKRSRLTQLGIKFPDQIALSTTGIAATTSVVPIGNLAQTITTPAQPLTLETLKHLHSNDIQVSPLTVAIDLKKEDGDVNLLASPRIRVKNKEKAKIHVGGGRMRSRNSGFTYLGLMAAIAISSAALAAGAEVWHTSIMREKENELLFVGGQFRQAIESYYRNTPGGVKRYPLNLEDLLKYPRMPGVQRHLRRIYRDPATGTTEWGLIPAPEGGIMSVYSLSEEAPLKSGNFSPTYRGFEGSTKYSQWTFAYQPKRGGRTSGIAR